MIRVELLSQRRRRSWSKALLSALIVCGGVYGIHQLFPAQVGSLFSKGSVLSSVVLQKIMPEPVAQQAATPKPVAQQEITPKPVAQQEAIPSPAQEIEPEPVEKQETAPKPVLVQREIILSPRTQQETTPSPVQEIAHKPTAQQEVALGSATQQETTPSSVAQQDSFSKPVAQQETTPSPVQETAPSSVVQQETAPAPTMSQAPSPQRSTVCHQIMRINEQVPAEISVASLDCNSTGEYRLEGTSPSHKVLRTFRLGLQALPSRVSFSVRREERALHFAFQGRFAERDASPLAALSSDQAEQFFGKVAHWADTSGLDSLSIHEPIHRPLSSAGTRQRQKLWGIGSPQQIGAFLHQFQQAEAVATLGEVLLVPVKSDEHGWVKARLYAAVDVVVGAP